MQNLEQDIKIGEFSAILGDSTKKVAIDILYLADRCEAAVGKKYQIEQLTAFENAGWRLIQVYEDEFNKNPELINSRINHTLGITEHKINARACKVVQLDVKTGKAFFAKNHIQGSGHGANLFVALEYNGEIVCAGSFGKARYNNIYQFELIRFASLQNYGVIGGGSRIISHAKKILGGGIVSYADRRFSNGNLYQQLGFTLLNISAPCYWYFNAESDKRWHRSAFMKHKLEKVLPIFDPQKSETENMKINNWHRIFDSGNYVFGLDA